MSDDAWAGDRVTRWLRQVDGLDRQLLPVTRVLLDAAGLGVGEAVLDVGCGSGPTTRTAAATVGPTGSVTGLDVSGEMLAAADSQPVPPGAAPLTWLEADVVGWSPPPGAFDVVISRFGVMFFSDPGAAFGRLAMATRTGGRLAVAVWGRREESALFEVPYAAALEVCRRRGWSVEAQPPDAGPFSLHDEAAVVGLLGDAGWSDVRMTPHRLTLPFAGGLDPSGAALAALDFGPTRSLLASVDEPTREETRDALRRVFAERLDPQGHVVLDASVRVITARR